MRDVGNDAGAYPLLQRNLADDDVRAIVLTVQVGRFNLTLWLFNPLDCEFWVSAKRRVGDYDES